MDDLMCYSGVYTSDCTDQAAVKGVLSELRRLKLVQDGQAAKTVYYKNDA